MARMSRIKFQTGGMGKNGFGFHRALLRSMSRDTVEARNRPHRGACFLQVEKQSAATQ